VRFSQGDLFAGIEAADLIVANPPYLLDDQQRTYRHGGPLLGADLSLRTSIPPHFSSFPFLPHRMSSRRLA